jgi:hypothetical protein
MFLSTGLVIDVSVTKTWFCDRLDLVLSCKLYSLPILE